MPRQVAQGNARNPSRPIRCRGIKPLPQKPARPNIVAAVLADASEPTYTELMSTEAKRLPRFLTTSLAAELGILLVLSVLFPFLIHILPVPEEARWGVRLLPMFYAPLLAALIGRTQTAAMVALAAPWLNWLLTSHPSPRSAVVTNLQLLVFVLAIRFLIRRVGPRWFLAVPAYVAGMVVSIGVFTLFPSLNANRPALAWAAQTLFMAWPGITVLLLINWLVVRNYPSGSGGGPMAA
jgi:hypothetical protein